MARRSLKSDDVEGFVRAFWDEVRDTEMRYGVHVTMDIRLRSTRGEIAFVAMAVRVDEEGQERHVYTAERVWPSHRYTALHAMLYSLASNLNIGVQKDYRDRTGDYYSSPTD